MKRKLKEVNVKTPVIPRHQLQHCLLVVKVGDNERPAGQEDLDSIRRQFNDALSNFSGCYTVIVTHHAISFESISLEGLMCKSLEIEKLTSKKKKSKECNSTILGLQPKD